MDLNKDIKDINLNIDVATITVLYKRYRRFLLPIVTIIISLILFFLIVSPQIQGVLSAKEQQRIEEEKLQVIKDNYSLLSSMDEGKLNSDFSLLTRALPSTKDFAGTINTISSNAVTSGVTVGDFQFSVGDISKEPKGISSFPSLQITLNVIGGSSQILNYIKSIYKSMPLAEVTNIQENKDKAEIKILFYYKAFPQGNISDEIKISPLSNSDKDLIEELSSWTTPEEPILLNTQQSTNDQASSSGEVTPPIEGPNPFQ